ncbi:hypothetical protein QYM36_008892, partial [Artemia franciscana]
AESLAKKISMENPYASPLAKELDNITLDSYVKSNLRTQSARDVIQAAVRASMGTEMCRLSALFFIAYANAAGGVMRLFLAKEGDAQELRVKGGTQQLSTIMASKIGDNNVLLKEPVVSIEQDDTGITVTTLNGKSLRAKYLVSTMPPNCLNRVHFSPPLPEGRRMLMHNMPSGHLTKFIVTYDKSYWTEEGYSGEIVSNGGLSNIDGISNGPLSVVYDATTNNGVPALVGFIAGRQGIEWAGVEAEVRKKAVLEDLAKCLGSWAKSPTSFIEKNWSDELYAGGCPVSFNVPGVAYSFQYLRKPEGRIFWAGTETATIWTGYISGAIQSGKRAAMEVLHNLSPNLVTEEELQGTHYDITSVADYVNPQLQHLEAKMMDQVDVVIVGAGVSGLTAGYRLLQKEPHLKIVVLEANDRVGGRTLTLDVCLPSGRKEPFDFGGQWVCTTQTHVMNMIKELDLEVYRQNTSGKKVAWVGENPTRHVYDTEFPFNDCSEIQGFIEEMEELSQKVPIEDPYSSPYAEELDSITLETLLTKKLKNKAVKDAFEAQVRGTLGAESSRLSALYFLAFANSAGGIMRLFLARDGDGQEFRVKGGTQQISQILAAKIGWDKIFLGQPVKIISQNYDGITVTTDGGFIFRGKYAIVSTPPNCTAKIEFNPPMPEIRRLFLNHMPMGHFTKFNIIYDKAYWLEEGLSGELTSNGGKTFVPGISAGPLGIVFDATTDNGVPALVGFIAAKNGVEWNEVDREVRKRAVLEDLAKAFGPWALNPVLYTEKNWSEE